MVNDKRSGGVAAVIAARGGSQGIPRKNLAPLASRPLIAYTIQAARACPWIDRVIVSTDDEEIAAVAGKWGAETPFLRPRHLAGGETTTGPTMRHAVEWLEGQGRWKVEVLCMMYPTSPFRTAALMDACLRPVLAGPATSTVTALRHETSELDLVRLDTDGRIRPVDPLTPVLYQTVGSVTVTDRRRGAKAPHTRYVPLANPVLTMDIDVPDDLQRAERIIHEGRWTWDSLSDYENLPVACRLGTRAERVEGKV